MTADEARALIGQDPAGVQVQSTNNGIVRLENVGGPNGDIALCRATDGTPRKIHVSELTKL